MFLLTVMNDTRIINETFSRHDVWLIKILGLFFVLAWRHGMFQSSYSVKSLELRVWFDVGVFQQAAVHESSSVPGTPNSVC